MNSVNNYVNNIYNFSLFIKKDYLKTTVNIIAFFGIVFLGYRLNKKRIFLINRQIEVKKFLQRIHLYKSQNGALLLKVPRSNSSITDQVIGIKNSQHLKTIYNFLWSPDSRIFYKLTVLNYADKGIGNYKIEFNGKIKNEEIQLKIEILNKKAFVQNLKNKEIGEYEKEDLTRIKHVIALFRKDKAQIIPCLPTSFSHELYRNKLENMLFVLNKGKYWLYMRKNDHWRNFSMKYIQEQDGAIQYKCRLGFLVIDPPSGSYFFVNSLGKQIALEKVDILSSSRSISGI